MEVKHRGRLRKKGQPLPILETIVGDKHTHWIHLTVQQWYGEKKRMIEFTSHTAVWYHTGHSVLPIRWVIVRDPKRIFKTQAFLCTDFSVSAEQIVQVCATTSKSPFMKSGLIWALKQRQWADLSILRMTPALLGLFCMLTLLANLHARTQKLPVHQTARHPKKLPTFSDALALVKEILFVQHEFPISLFPTNIRKPQPTHLLDYFPRSIHPFSGISIG